MDFSGLWKDPKTTLIGMALVGGIVLMALGSLTLEGLLALLAAVKAGEYLLAKGE